MKIKKFSLNTAQSPLIIYNNQLLPHWTEDLKDFYSKKYFSSIHSNVLQKMQYS